MPFVKAVILFSLIILGPWQTLAQVLLPEFEEMVILAPLPLTHEFYTIKRNSSVHQALIEAGVDAQMIHDVVKSARPKFNLRHIQPGTTFSISKEPSGDIKEITFDIAPLNRLKITYHYNEWNSEIIEVETTTELEHFAGSIDNSLWASAVEQNLSPEIIVDFAEVFGWQVDFSREVRKGDRWRFTVEKLYSGDKHVGWGHILYAEYYNGPELYKAYFYKNKATGTQGYFDENGESLRKVFLKSPIKFGRITSHFSRRRFHPIHRRYKAHNGVDYGAPRGTPIRVVGDGRIVKIGRFGGSGKMIIVDHIAGYKTKYLHMSRFHRGMRRGKKVLQGQIIGYVGSTGYATGPHLHFEMSKFGSLMDPLKVNLPAADPVPDKAIAHFKKYISGLERSIASTFPDLEHEEPINSNVELKTKNAAGME